MGLSTNLVAAAAVALAASVSSADVWHHDWTFYNDSGGYGALDAKLMYITGGDVGVPGWTSYRTTMVTKTDFRFYVNYSSDDSQQYDFFYIQINGNEVARIYNEDEWEYYDFRYTLEAGDVINLGVYTVDGASGPGVAVVYLVQALTLLGINDFDWQPYSQNGSGSVSPPPPDLEVVGGNAGFEDWTHAFIVPQVGMLAVAGGTYSSPDEGTYDEGYVYTSGYGYGPFIDNASQGAFDGVGALVSAHSVVGFGVHTTDGALGAGTLTIDSFTGYMFPGILSTFSWWTFDTAYGYVEYEDVLVRVTGGNNGIGGYTEFAEVAEFNYHVESDFTYKSFTDVELYDRAYYTVNGVRTYIADNAHQGDWYMDFEVSKGDTFGFGVETSDGQGGPGILSIYRMRAWATPGASCYADFTGDGSLDLFDFLAFVNSFNAGEDDADCTGDGTRDLFDFLCFVNAFNTGC